MHKGIWRDRKCRRCCTRRQPYSPEGRSRSWTEFTHLIENKQDAIQIGEAYCLRREAYLHQGAVDLAVGDFVEALDRNPEMAEAYLETLL